MQPVRTFVQVAGVVAMLGSNASCSGAHIPPPPRPVSIPDPEQLVGAYYRRVNAEDLEGVLALMVRDPVMVEPFSHPSQRTVHHGYRDVAEFFAYGFRTRDDQIVPEFIRAGSNGIVEAGWSLQGADGTGVSGTSRFIVSGGQIARVEIEIRD